MCSLWVKHIIFVVVVPRFLQKPCKWSLQHSRFDCNHIVVVLLVYVELGTVIVMPLLHVSIQSSVHFSRHMCPPPPVFVAECC